MNSYVQESFSEASKHPVCQLLKEVIVPMDEAISIYPRIGKARVTNNLILHCSYSDILHSDLRAR